MPDWLADVVQAESKGPLPGPLPSNEIPKWLLDRLEDLRLWIGLEVHIPAAPTTDSAPLNSGQPGDVPDWLQGWLTPETPIVSLPPSPTMPVALRVPPVASTNPLVEKIRQLSGFDLETGQILDPVKFAKWKQQQTQSGTAGQPAVSNASLLEVFRKGRSAIEAWVDDDKNRSSVMHAVADEIKTNQEIQAILHQYMNYGKGLQEKLLRHLEFMVENRRNYYKAVAGPLKGIG